MEYMDGLSLEKVSGALGGPMPLQIIAKVWGNFLSLVGIGPIPIEGRLL